MQDKRKIDYIRFLLLKLLQDLSRYDLQKSQILFLEKLSVKFLSSEEPLRNAYILSRTRGFEKLGRYFIYILKKLDDGVIRYDNLSQNLNSDIDFIEKEILNFFSNPAVKENYADISFADEPDDTGDIQYERDHDFTSDEETASIKPHRKVKTDSGEKEKHVPEQRGKNNYLELIKSDPDSSEDDETVYELPVSGTTSGNDELLTAEEETEEIFDEDQELQIRELNRDVRKDEDIPKVTSVTGDEEIKFSTKKYSFVDDSFEADSVKETENILKTEKSSILEEGVSEILDDYRHDEEKVIAEDEKPTNAIFLQYEEEVKKKNQQLTEGFDDMIEYLAIRNKDLELRATIIKNILEVSSYLEEYSRKLSLEIISNIYQTITLSFEKISEGKYDISDTTLNLFKSSLEFVIKLIRGDDYYLYEETLKSVEKLRSTLLEEKTKREREIVLKKEKQELELRLIEKYPETNQRERVKELKRTISKIEERFDSLEKVSGEYQVYEALRSLSGNLSYLKEIVNLSLDLNLPRLAQLAEGSYIFIKFLQNYRINPINPEIKEIFNYITHNLKLLIFDRHLKELDLFISYLNDPVKIFTKPDKKK
jgi:hypothetical protein